MRESLIPLLLCTIFFPLVVIGVIVTDTVWNIFFGYKKGFISPITSVKNCWTYLKEDWEDVVS